MKPRNFINLDEQSPEVNPWRQYHAIPAIGPRGELCVRFRKPGVPSADQDCGHTPIILAGEKAVIDGQFERIGWVLYEDLCYGRIPGIEADPGKWVVWERYVKLMAGGKSLAKNAIPDEKFWHAEVLRRREGKGGWVEWEKDEMLAFLFGEQQSLSEDDTMAALFDDEPEETPKKKGKK